MCSVFTSATVCARHILPLTSAIHKIELVYSLSKYMLFYEEPSSRPSSKISLFLDLFLSTSRTKSSFLVPNFYYIYSQARREKSEAPGRKGKRGPLRAKGAGNFQGLEINYGKLLLAY